MAKHKLAHFEELTTFAHVFQPTTEICLSDSFKIKGNWHTDFFNNQNPITLELGCGKGEYTIGLAERFPERNFIGVDIKGSRIWRGAKTAIENNMKNVAFVRCRIDNIASIFNKDEIDEIWITFPDPQPTKAKKRLMSSKFLNLYQKFLKPNSLVHLKTDNLMLFKYISNLLKLNQLTPIISTDNLYQSNISSDLLNIKTHYETIFIKQGIEIKYICFKLPQVLLTETP